jgi:hypothetical protein
MYIVDCVDRFFCLGAQNKGFEKTVGTMARNYCLSILRVVMDQTLVPSSHLCSR